jgi:hypothetical protein
MSESATPPESYENPTESDHKKIIRIDVRGEDHGLWAKFRPKLIAKIQEVLDTTLDHEHGTTVGEEAKKFTSGMLEFARQRLQREGLENDKIEAEVAKIYADRTNALADADLKTAQAEKIRSQIAKEELILCLAMSKMMIVGDISEEAILFGQQIDAFLCVVREMKLLAHG